MVHKYEGLNPAQLEIIRELVDDAMSKTVKSMEQMLNIPLRVDFIDFGNGYLSRIHEFDQLGRFKVNVVKVTFRGEVKGACYFLINAYEIDAINRWVLPESVTSKKNAASRMMKKSFMSEIENMIAALSISEISDSLGVELLGDVPQVRVMRGEEVNEFLESENELNETAFHVKTILAGRYGVNVAPFFIWLLDRNFIEKLKLNIVA